MVLMIVVIGFFVSQVDAAPRANLNWGYNLSASETACGNGKEILNVKRKIENTLDSGTGTNDYGNVWWAKTNYIQHIRVFDLGGGNFCATIKTQGDFESVGGDGPGCNTDSNCGTPDGRIEAGVFGTFHGGATISFSGVFTPGDLKVKGNIGTLDNGCDASTGCPKSGFNAWLDDYFTAVSDMTYDWWGWVYRAGDNGTWVNAASGNEGNITGE